MTHRKPEAVIVRMTDHPSWTESECIDIFWRLLIMGWLQPDRMSVELAADYGRKLGHYGLRELARRERERQQGLVEQIRSHV